MVVVVAVVVIAKQMPLVPGACSLVCCPIYTDTKHLDSTLACSDLPVWDVAKTRPQAFNKWRTDNRAQAPRQGSLQGLRYATPWRCRR